MHRRIKYFAFATLGVALVVAAALLLLPESARAPSESASVPDESSELVLPVIAPEAWTGEWNTYHGDNSLRGVAETAIPDRLQVLWRVPMGGPVRRPPVALGGRIMATTVRGALLAVGLDGEVLWRHTVEAEEDGRPVYVEAPITAFGNQVFLGTESGLMLAFDVATGAMAWRTNIHGSVRGAPNYLPDRERLVVLDQEIGALICLDAATGEEHWRTSGVDRCDGSPAIYGSLAVFGSCASAVHLVSTDTGEALQDIKIENGGGQVADGVAVVAGMAYVGVRDGRVMRIALESGAILWTTVVSEDEVFSTPAVHGDLVVVTVFDGYIYALDRETGVIQWQRDLGWEPRSPVIAGDKVIVAADGVLYLLRLEDGGLVWEQRLGDEISGPAVLAGMIVVGGEDGVLTALVPEVEERNAL